VGGTGRVLAFEPGPECFAALRKSVATNGLEQVVLRRQALSDRQAPARLYHHRGRANSFGLGQSSDPNVSYEEVETTTVERALVEERLSHVDFIKLDVEGAQELVLRGSRSVILHSRPMVLVEIDAGACRRLNLDPDGACRMLRDFGYRFYALGTRGEMVPLANPEGIRRVLAVHETHRLEQRKAVA
jgi:FkbM family methyltransferase